MRRDDAADPLLSRWRTRKAYPPWTGQLWVIPSWVLWCHKGEIIDRLFCVPRKLENERCRSRGKTEKKEGSEGDEAMSGASIPIRKEGTEEIAGIASERKSSAVFTCFQKIPRLLTEAYGLLGGGCGSRRNESRKTDPRTKKAIQ